MKQEEFDRERETIRQRNDALDQEKREKNEEIKRQKEINKQKALNSLKKRNEKSLWEKYKDYVGYGVLGALFIFVLISNFTGNSSNSSKALINDEKYIRKVNEANGQYSVSPVALFDKLNLKKLRGWVNNKFSSKKTIQKCPVNVHGLTPASYNFYTEFPNCRTDAIISPGSTSYMNIALDTWRNRNCRQGGDSTFVPSAEYILACDKLVNTGAKGGYLVSTIDYFLKNGVVDETCWNKVEKAKGTCPNKEAFKDCAKQHIQSYCVFENVEDIKAEIAAHGPVISFVPV